MTVCGCCGVMHEHSVGLTNISVCYVQNNVSQLQLSRVLLVMSARAPKQMVRKSKQPVRQWQCSPVSVCVQCLCQCIACVVCSSRSSACVTVVCDKLNKLRCFTALLQLQLLLFPCRCCCCSLPLCLIHFHPHRTHHNTHTVTVTWRQVGAAKRV